MSLLRYNTECHPISTTSRITRGGRVCWLVAWPVRFCTPYSHSELALRSCRSTVALSLVSYLEIFGTPTDRNSYLSFRSERPFRRFFYLLFSMEDGERQLEAGRVSYTGRLTGRGSGPPELSYYLGFTLSFSQALASRPQGYARGLWLISLLDTGRR